MTTISVEISLYNAYGDSAGWKNFRGEPMPKWDDLPNEIQENWRAVARFVHEKYTYEASSEKQLKPEVVEALRKLIEITDLADHSKPQKVRAKFTCNFKIINQENGQAEVGFNPVYTGSEENKDFWKYTPSGSIAMTITNSQAFDRFETGREYYVDFTPAD